MHAENNIVVNAPVGIYNEPGNSSSQLSIAHNLIFDTPRYPTSGVFDMGGNILDQDPLFTDPANGDFHLICNATECSPAVDAGDPNSDYTNEPNPNGCQVNMGAYGNTAEAATDPNATHCP